MRVPFVALLGLAVLVSASPLRAHHSVAAEFDNTQPVSIKGTITKVEWMNPHIWVYLNVADEQGKITEWQCEGAGPITLRRSGWTRDTLKVGTEISVEGIRARNGSPTCNSRNWSLANGKRLFVGSPGDGGPGPGQDRQQ